MKTYIQELGKISITANGKWDIHNDYDRLCMVHDGMFATYISRKRVPPGINIEDTEYWQPVANLKDIIKIDYNQFKETTNEDILNFKELVLTGEEAFKLSVNNILSLLKEMYEEHDYWVKHLVPEVSWTDLEKHFDAFVQDIYRSGRVKFGITTVDYLKDLDGLELEDTSFVYVEETKKYYIFNTEGQTWYETPIWYVGTKEPLGNPVWFNPDDKPLAKTDTELNNIKRELNSLKKQVSSISNITAMGIIPGDSTTSYRTLLLGDDIEPVKPEVEDPNKEVVEDEETTGDEDTIVVEDEDYAKKPETTDVEHTVTCVCCKIDTAANFSKNKQNLVDGELLFFSDKKKFGIYYQGQFFLNGAGSTGGNTEQGGESGQGDNTGKTDDEFMSITVADIYGLNLEHLTFANAKKKFKTTVDSANKWVVREIDNGITTDVTTTVKSYNVYVSQFLSINNVFCGTESDDAVATHNYIELANASNEDINLNGLYIATTDTSRMDGKNGYNWDILPLEGVIKSQGTYLIRGAECNTVKRALLDVNTYDQIWLKDGEPIKFAQNKVNFTLFGGTEIKELMEAGNMENPYAGVSTSAGLSYDSPKYKGYIDSCGFGTDVPSEGMSPLKVEETNWNKIFFVRWFTFETAKQGNKNNSARKTSALWTYIVSDKVTTHKNNCTQFYYSKATKIKYTPKASYEHKDFFTNKTTFVVNHANYINITFGIQATASSTTGATRCFNWISVGDFDEYVQIRKKGTSTWTEHYSIIDDDDSNPAYIKANIEHYRRLYWTASDGTEVVTHKCIIKNLTAGDYEYRIGRKGDESYYSKIFNFTVISDSDAQSFSFLHVTDQQGFNWQEYTAWHKTAEFISKNEKNYNFLINTGDITQSGNRVNEWLDYYEGKTFIDDKVEMFTIGNNDLCGYDSTILTDGEDKTSKYSHINVLRYFCFELDSNNVHSFTFEGKQYPIYSLYSFNFGPYHFVSLNSEIAIATIKMYKEITDGDGTAFAEAAGAAIEAWLKKDLQIWKGNTNEPTDCSKCIVYMHEMPFTIITVEFVLGNAAREGSHLNTLNANGTYRFSRLFKKYGIKLVIGGHKHTYSISKPIYDAPDGYIKNNTVDSSVALISNVKNVSTVTDALSRQPVIQVKSKSEIPGSDEEASKLARYEVISEFTAPTYVMCQASSYKLVSNKELPVNSEHDIPWLLAYFKAGGKNKEYSENTLQHHPMYIEYDVTPNNITIIAKQVVNVTADENSKKYFNMNVQNTDVKNKKVTCSTTSNKDKTTYGVTDIEKYVISI